MRSIKLPSWTERLAGLTPVPPPPHVFALDDERLRYGCLRRRAEGYVYESAQEVALPADVFGEGLLGGPVRDPQAFGELVGGFVRGLPEPVEEASLVLPDAWLRLTFTELAELPAKISAREDVLRWKLKRLVPFRVEDLRVSATEVTPFPAQEEPIRLMIGFAIELLIAELEDAFAIAGVELGQITNTTLALYASIEPAVDPAELTGLAIVGDGAYTLSFHHRREPLLYRYKAFAEGGIFVGARESSVRRDLRLTLSFLNQHFPDQVLRQVFLAAPADKDERWREWLSSELAAETAPLAFEHFALARTQVGATSLETAPLLGAARIEVT